MALVSLLTKAIVSLVYQSLTHLSSSTLSRLSSTFIFISSYFPNRPTPLPAARSLCSLLFYSNRDDSAIRRHQLARGKVIKPIQFCFWVKDASKLAINHLYSFTSRLMFPQRVIVTPAVYSRLDEPLHLDIQSTGQKSHCVNITL